MTDSSPTPDTDRIERITAALRENQFDALLCSISSHVLMLTGYWPIMGNTVALVTANGDRHLLLPGDEVELAGKLSVAHRTTFAPGTLDQITNSEKAIARPLAQLARSLGLDRARIGVASRGFLGPVSYLSQYHYGNALDEILRDAFPNIALLPADDLLKRLSAVKTAREIDCLRRSCGVARMAYQEGAAALRVGLHEPGAAELFRSAAANAFHDGRNARAEAYFFCMSGINSATAHAAYARTRERAIEPGDLAMIHCNSSVDGYWTDITRSYTFGEPDDRQVKMRTAILEARSAALARIAPGVPAHEVDAAARNVLAGYGYGENFKHGTGHGVCFAAANHDAIPRVHPKSTDVLETGMTFNVEPAIYIEGYGGMRHCDVVAVTSRGVEVLTDFQAASADLNLRG